MKKKTLLLSGCIIAVVLTLCGVHSLVYAQDKDTKVPVAINGAQQTQQRQTNEDYCSVWDVGESDFFMLPHSMNRLMNEMCRPRSANQFDFSPNMDVIQTEKQFILQFDLPGMTKENIDVQVKDNVLSIAGVRKDKWQFEGNDKGQYVQRTARKYGRFSRSIQLPEDIDIGDVNARYENGVLEISIGYEREEEKEKVFNVEVS